MPYADPERQRAYFKERKERMKAEGTWVAHKRNKEKDRARYHANHDENLAKQRAYNAAHVEDRRVQRNEWAKKNPEKIKAQKARLRERQGDALRAKLRDFVKQKPEGSSLTRSQIYCRRRREKYGDKLNERQRLHGLCPKRRIEIHQKLEVCKNICYICGLHLDIGDMDVDHVHPVSAGGTSHIHNLMPTHKRCNKRKHKKTDFPIARPDLVELAKCVEELPPGKRRVKTQRYIQAMKMGTK